MIKIIAKRPILFESRQYRSGDELPTKNAEMVKAWIEGGSAVVEDLTASVNPSVAAEAVPAPLTRGAECEEAESVDTKAEGEGAESVDAKTEEAEDEGAESVDTKARGAKGKGAKK